MLERMNPIKLTPRLVVSNASAALRFYVEAMGATELERFADPNLDGKIVHAAFELGGNTVALTDEHPAFCNVAPSTLGGSAVLISLEVDDPDELCTRMVEHGAEVVIPIADRFYGRREGRIRDPFGHLWILSKVLETLDAEEIQRRIRGA